MTMILGVTGGIATGKSTVSQIFAVEGHPVIDADLVAREVVMPGSVGLQNIVAHFGREVLQSDGTLDRKKLGELVFNNPEARKKLDDMLDHDIRARIDCLINETLATHVPLIVVDIPLLFEAHYDTSVDEIMVVYVPQAVQLERLCKRNNLTLAEGRVRLESQMSIESKKELADSIIDNSGELSQTKKQVIDWLIKHNFKTSY